MTKLGDFNHKEFKAWAKQIDGLTQSGVDAAFQSAANEVGAQLWNTVVRRTPVGVPPAGISEDTFARYWSGYSGGTLRRSWTVSPAAKSGNAWLLEVTNTMGYATYVEYGHRQEAGRFIPALGKRAKATWVPGRHMLQLSIQAIEPAAGPILEKHVGRLLENLKQGG